MCGIIGYIGGNTTPAILLDGLKRLEYRGYDSCGIAVVGDSGALYLKRVSGRVDVLDKLVAGDPVTGGQAGVGHTRWATHGAPSEDNAHPHTDCSAQLVVVHNGIIENYLDLKEQLLASGHHFKSETDTEVIAHTMEAKLTDLHVPETAVHADQLESVFFQAFRKTVADLKGSFALAMVWSRCPGLVLAARLHSPLVVGLGRGENFVASDVSAFLAHTKQVVFLNDGELAEVRKDAVDFYTFQGRKIVKDVVTIQWNATMAEKGGYAHFMLKEIHEQSEAVENTLRGRLLPLDGTLLKAEMGLSPRALKSFSSVQFIACGTAHHAGLVGRILFETFGIEAAADVASEFTDRARLLNKGVLAVAISQSGETADTLFAVREARAAGAQVLAITNTVGSTLTRESDYVFYTHCGPEIGVASTKAFLGQLAAVYLLAGHFAAARGRLPAAEARRYAENLLKIPRLINETLAQEPEIAKIANGFASSEHFLFISRHINYPIALEGALKIKEISYVHAEGYAAGEMKHGPIAIIYKGMPLLAVATSGRTLDLMAGNVEEAKARGAEVVAIVDEDSRKIIRASHYIVLPRTAELLTPLLTVIPLQLFAYYVALAKKCDIDKPRNLAKSVTVR
jgi:glucosamine--fructose-6-phosphate aminotransferase (isomerizing)